MKRIKSSIEESTLTPEQKQKGVWLSGIEGEGEYKIWHSNGQLSEHSFWKEGNLHGERMCYYESGQLLEHSFYKNGSWHGESKWYFASGGLVAHSFWKEGNLVKEYKVKKIKGVWL